MPYEITAHIEQELRHTIRTELGDRAEYKREYQSRTDRLQHSPERTKHRLLILDREIALDKQADQVPILPALPEINIIPV